MPESSTLLRCSLKTALTLGYSILERYSISVNHEVGYDYLVILPINRKHPWALLNGSNSHSRCLSLTVETVPPKGWSQPGEQSDKHEIVSYQSKMWLYRKRRQKSLNQTVNVQNVSRVTALTSLWSTRRRNKNGDSGDQEGLICFNFRRFDRVTK